MFKEGEIVIYTYFSWADEDTVREKVRVIQVLEDGNKYYIENSAGTVKRTVRSEELSSINKSNPSPFGQII